jgi:hypothetical protein
VDDRHHVAIQEGATAGLSRTGDGNLGRGAHVHIHASDQVMRTATTMYREMDLRFWQEQEEAAKLA